MTITYFKPSFIALLFLFVLHPLHSQKAQKTETRELSFFEELKVSGPFTVQLTSSLEDQLTITADPAIISLVVTEVKDGILRIHPKKNAYLKNIRWKEVELKIPFVPLKKISQSGSGKITSPTPMVVPSIALRQSGSGNMTLTLQTKKTILNASGSGRVELKGETQKLQAKLSGAGQLQLQNITAKEGDFTLSGSGEIQTHCTHRLKGNVSGSGKILYHGEPQEKLNAKVSGSGVIRLITQ